MQPSSELESERLLTPWSTQVGPAAATTASGPTTFNLATRSRPSPAAVC